MVWIYKYTWVDTTRRHDKSYTNTNTYFTIPINFNSCVFKDAKEIRVNIISVEEDSYLLKSAKFNTSKEKEEEHRKHLIETIMKSKDAGTGDDFTDKEKFPIDLLEEIQRQVFKEYAEDNLLPWGQERDIAIQAFYKEHFNND